MGAILHARARTTIRRDHGSADGGQDRQGGADEPLVVLMHDFGAPGTDLIGLWRVLDVPRNFRFAFPEAPEIPPGMEDATDQVVEMLEWTRLVNRHPNLSKSIEWT